MCLSSMCLSTRSFIFPHVICGASNLISSIRARKHRLCVYANPLRLLLQSIIDSRCTGNQVTQKKYWEDSIFFQDNFLGLCCLWCLCLVQVPAPTPVCAAAALNSLDAAASSQTHRRCVRSVCVRLIVLVVK